MSQRVNPSVLHPLKEALTLAFWYKRDLRAFLNTVLPDVGWDCPQGCCHRRLLALDR